MTVVAYCGLPPSPAGIWTHWRLDPIVLSVLFAWLASYVAGACALRGTARRLKTREIAFFCSGWAIATLALVSPLCPLSVALFSARATQHVILTLLAAPLVVAGRPLDAVLAGLAGHPGTRWPQRASAYPMRAAAAVPDTEPVPAVTADAGVSDRQMLLYDPGVTVVRTAADLERVEGAAAAAGRPLIVYVCGIQETYLREPDVWLRLRSTGYEVIADLPGWEPMFSYRVMRKAPHP